MAPSGKGVAGRQGMGNAGDDGGFTVSTYEDNDGAVVGKHLVMITASKRKPYAELVDVALNETYRIDINLDDGGYHAKKRL